MKSIFFFCLLSQLIFQNSWSIDFAQGENRLKANAGYGEYSDIDDYEGMMRLKRRCAEFAQENGLKGNCQLSCSKEISQNGFLEVASNLQEDFSQYLLSNYATRILNSEIKNCGREPGEVLSCSSSTVKSPINSENALASELAKNLPDRENVRKNAMKLPNVLSAALLYARAQLAPANEAAVKEYKRRIELSFPFLFKPDANGFASLLRVLSDNGVPLPKQNLMQGDIQLHSRSMNVITSTLDANPGLKNQVEAKLETLLSDYAVELKKDFVPSNLLCLLKPEDIYKKYPAIVNQAMIDLPANACETIGRSLCQSKEYYDPSTYDSDCDGVPDSNDEKPLDTFVPKSEFNVYKRDAENPPFGTWGLYDLKKVDNKIVLGLKVNVKVENDVDGALKETFMNDFNKCLNDRLQNDFVQNFEVLKQDKKSYFTPENSLEVKFDVTQNSDSSGYVIHKCWCSTCTFSYTFEGQTKKVPRFMCLDDLKNGTKPASLNISDAEMAAMTAAYTTATAGGAKVWWHQEDAGNLTIKTVCDTIRHETVHRFGLPDEYTGSYYPFNRVGRRDSLMHLHINGKFLPRHLSRILAPVAGGTYCAL